MTLHPSNRVRLRQPGPAAEPVMSKCLVDILLSSLRDRCDLLRRIKFVFIIFAYSNQKTYRFRDSLAVMDSDG